MENKMFEIDGNLLKHILIEKLNDSQLEKFTKWAKTNWPIYCENESKMFNWLKECSKISTEGCNPGRYILSIEGFIARTNQEEYGISDSSKFSFYIDLNKYFKEK